MDKINIIKQLLKEVGMPVKQQSDLCSLTILAMAGLHENDKFTIASNEWIRIHDIISYIKENYNVKYAENSRETFRKQAIHHFRNAALIEDNGKPTNSPNTKYRLTKEFLPVLQNYEDSYKKNTDNKELKQFLKKHTKLIELYASKKKMKKMPVRINDKDYTFSPGKHNKLQKAIIEEFAPRFAAGSECLYVGDTTKKDMVKNTEKLKAIGFDITLHDKMPDVVLYKEDENWLYFIEAVDSVGPMSPDRIRDIEQMTQNVKAGKIYVTAFLNFDKYKKFSKELAWETEVWIADTPDHMIHLNGDKFLGPR